MNTVLRIIFDLSIQNVRESMHNKRILYSGLTKFCFRDLDLMERCLDSCSSEFRFCSEKCDSDYQCQSVCQRELDHCNTACPCYGQDCINGCDQCQNTICQCKVRY